MNENEERLRIQAINRYLTGGPPSAIWKSLGRSNYWFFKWLSRFKSGDENWYKSLSRAPKNPHRSTNQKLDELIINIRKKLENTKYAQIGAVAISWELKKLKVEPPPSWTIDRIIKRHGLTKKRGRGYQAKGKAYPKIEADFPNKVHQVDLLGPRFLASKEHFYSLNVMDIGRHKVKINPIRARNADWAIDSLLQSWQKLGLPCFVQFDNQGVFFGSDRRPRWFSKVIKLCLNLGIEPVFIPLREPWRNGEIERFNDTWDKKFFRTQHFENFTHLAREAEIFEDFHNDYHRYNVLKGATPNEFEKKSGFKPRLLPPGFAFKEPDSLSDGKIHLVRFIRSDLTLNVFGEKFILEPSCQYEYVTATIYVKEQVLRVFLFGNLIKEIKYTIPKR